MCDNINKKYSRRDFLTTTSLGLGALAMSQIVNPLHAMPSRDLRMGGLGLPHFPPKVKRVIYLMQSGAPSQMDLFDYKPMLDKMHGQELPESIRKGQRLTGMTAGQTNLPLTRSHFEFKQHGQSGAWISDLMPHVAEIADDLTFIKSMHTDAINHDPAITFFQTGSQFAGRPSIGSWVSYGLGSDNKNLPSFVVLVSKDKKGQPLYSRLWGNGFLPSEHQGVQFRGGKDPVLYLTNPDGISKEMRRGQLDALDELQRIQANITGDPEIDARLAQYEMAYRMQTSVPEVTDTSDEPDYIYDMYGPDSKEPGTYAANCLLARRLIEKDVKFVQLYHRGWDTHRELVPRLKTLCKETDQPTAALIKDLKQRGLLEDTLVIWGGEFGRTNYSQNSLDLNIFGRDHHPNCFTLFMAGAGVKSGLTYGATDDFSYNITENPVHVHDFQATLLHLLGVDHERLTFKYQGRRFRLTDVHGHVVKDILS